MIEDDSTRRRLSTALPNVVGLSPQSSYIIFDGYCQQVLRQVPLLNPVVILQINGCIDLKMDYTPKLLFRIPKLTIIQKILGYNLFRQSRTARTQRFTILKKLGQTTSLHPSKIQRLTVSVSLNFSQLLMMLTSQV